MVFIYGLIMVFLILAAQYENATVQRDDGRAVRGVLSPAGGLAARDGKRRVFPDRPADLGRAGGQERHPDRGVRGDEVRGGNAGSGSGGGGGALAPRS